MSNASSKSIAVFLSYRNQEPSKSEAEHLYEVLTENGFKVFYDQKGLRGGEKWAERIYDEIRISDVLCVLLQTGEEAGDGRSTAESEWVQREIDVARGANVSILPLNLYLDEVSNLAEVQRLLAIYDRQFHKYTSPKRAIALTQKKQEDEIEHIASLEDKSVSELYKERKRELEEDREQARKDSERQLHSLIETIETLAKVTREQQQEWIQDLQDRRSPRQAPLKRSHHQRPLANGINLHIATGDMTEIPEIDVIVNSENNYLQMARIIEWRTLSSTLRQKGAHVEHGRLFADSVQGELNQQIERIYGKLGGLPIQVGQVIPTSSGYKKSRLAQKGYRYILHAVTMTYSSIEQKNDGEPIKSDSAVVETLLRCFETFKAINELRGNIHEKDEYAEADDFQPLTSMIFPIIATGHGGRPIREVVRPMIQACKQAAHEAIAPNLKDIFISVYAEDNISTVLEAMDEIVPIEESAQS